MPRARVCLMALVVLSGLSVSSSTSAQEGAITQLGPNVPPPRDAKPVIGRSVVRGRVLAAESGQPLRRATVGIRAAELRVPRSTMTDADGRYEFRELPAGRYSINVSKTPFVGWSYGQTQPGSAGKPLVLADNQTADSINIAMPRGAVITGTITDELGEPVPNASVSLLRPQFVQGQQRLMPAGAASFPSTNDIGEYRMFGLPPGQYYVAAQPQQQAFSTPGPLNGQVEGQEARNGYARTFYPGTADVSGAQKVTVELGQTISEMNIVLLQARLATVSGVAVDSQGQLLGGGFVQIMPRGAVFAGGFSGGPLSPDGTFRVPNVPPGLYTLRANAPRTPPAPGAPPVPPEFSVAVVAVAGEDVTDVRLMPVQPVAVRGKVSFDDSAAAQAVNPSAVRVMAQALNVDDMSIGFPGAGGPGTLADDFTFELKVPPGRVALRAMVQSAPTASTGWQVKAVRVNGTDVTDSGIEVDARGADGIEIELTNRRQEISGAVTDAGSGPVKDYTVIVFAQDRARWASPFNRYFGTGRPGDDGRFRVGTLPPGDYYAIALDRVDPTQSQDPEFLEGLSRQAFSFSLSPGDTRTLDLRLFTVQ